MNPIYLDYQSTTPLASEARAAMLPWLEDGFGNPHSSHRMGREAAAVVELAREQVLTAFDIRSSRVKTRGGETGPAAPLVCTRDERLGGRLIFTSGATEAANVAIQGSVALAPPARRKIVTLATEHACILDTCQWLGTRGIEVELLGVQPDGLVDLASAAEAIDEETLLVAAMLVNNEIGVVQPVAEIAALAREAGALFLCDAVQAYGRVAVPEGCDMIAISAHKIHGPKGIGALWLSDGVELEPLLHGGGQEGGLRSGTLSPALCAGFGAAAKLAAERAGEDRAHVERLWTLATDLLAGWTINGSTDRRWRGNLNIRREGVDSARLLSEVRDVAFSSGSACASGSGRPSHVLRALGLTEREAASSIRLGFGRYTSEAELGEALGLIASAAERQLRFAA